MDGADDGSGFGACRDTAEDADGFEDGDGCVDPDNDVDGVPDEMDGPVDDTGYGACRDAAEDADGFEDGDGCPDLDNDGDGLPDTADGEVDATGFGACRDQAEDFDGFEDDDGCPEEGEGLVALTCDAIEIAASVYFDTASDVIQTRSYELLDQVATVLNSATYIQLVRVEGHTDDRGDDDYNLDLSQRRAASVLRYLSENGGVDASRLESEGFGETQPIDDNDTRSGRAANRRVEFVIVQQDSRCEAPAEE
jgi:outer membrane protein OmpA-like peptidoglycan-associated protein